MQANISLFIVDSFQTSSISTDEPLTPLGAISSSTPINGLTRSRRSHFSRKDSSPEFNSTAAVAPQTNSAASFLAGGLSPNDLPISAAGGVGPAQQRIVHEYQRMMYYAKSPHSWALPANWAHICEQFPVLVRNKVNNTNSHHQGMAGHKRDVYAMRTTSLTASLECTN